MVLAVQERIGGVSRTIIYEWVKKGHFPKPIK
ncbi:MAG TPA: AlpA family phage regulatory protein [Paenalcaligenes hominis]|uniref:AlpA family phage regulatory protein n=1 Tax=Paenalcaligenes hominis TaxID=643674 RepID=A0A9D2VFQ4_9BURK|nr:AlpA family phage regulatory protein [Paenalcaligenes hominis]